MLKRAFLAATLFSIAGTAHAGGQNNYGVNTYALTRNSGDSSFDWAGYNAQLQGGPFGVIFTGRTGSQFLSGFAQGATGSQSGTVSSNTYLTAANDTATTTDNTTATANAAADLTTGALHASASGGTYICCGGYTYGTVGSSLAQFGDGLTFNIPGATSQTVTDIQFTMRTDGTFVGGYALYSESILAGLAVVQAGQANAQYYGGYEMDNVNAPVMNYNTQSGWVSSSIIGTAGDYTFTGVYALYGANPYINFGSVLNAVGTNGFADYFNTAELSLQLPAGVTFTSDSGVFLSGLGSVPEPASWALMLAGFGVSGAALRRRRGILA